MLYDTIGLAPNNLCQQLLCSAHGCRQSGAALKQREADPSLLAVGLDHTVEMTSMITFSLLVIEHPLNTEHEKRFCLVHEIDDR
jgi:hypothetical protein